MGQFIFTKPGISTLDYVATGAEGTTLTLPALFGRRIDLVTYNTLVLIPETPPPDAQGYSYNATTSTFTFGFPLNPDDVLQILFT